MELNKYILTDKVREEYKPIVQKYIEVAEASSDPVSALELTDTELNPYTLWKVLEELGYEQGEIDSNGWQMDFWVNFKKDGCKNLTIECTGITFEMKLLPSED